MAKTGMRSEEAIGLQWQYVHADTLDVRETFYRGHWDEPKTAAGRRTVVLTPRLATQLEALRQSPRFSAGSRQLVFPSKDGTPLSYTNLYNRMFVPATKALGIDGRGGFHALRRTFATVMEVHGSRHGWNATWIKRVMGHSLSDDLTASVYQHPTEMDYPPIDFLDGIIGREGANSTVRVDSRMTQTEAPPPAVSAGSVPDWEH